MRGKVFGATKLVIFNAFAIICAVAIAIVIHAALPASINIEKLDGVFVKLLGFPVVSVIYFIFLFIHCVVAMRFFGNGSNIPKLQIGLRFGLAFAILYFFGMQEVVIEYSPFREWGSAFVKYQFFMGVGDVIPVLLLCGTVAWFSLENNNTSSLIQAINRAKKIKVVTIITSAFLIERAIGYETGIITSSCNTYPIPCYIWTFLFGIMLGCSYLVLYPVFAKEQDKLLLSIRLAVLTIGVNWMLFNSFIGLIFSGLMPQALLRSGIDALVLFLSSFVINKYIVKSEIHATDVFKLSSNS